MEFEWHNVKNAENVRKHGIDFDWARLVFDDPHVFEYDDHDPCEDRANAIGLIGNVLVHVTYTMRGDVCRIISATGAAKTLKVMSDDGITRVKHDPANPPKADWSRFDAMTEAERHAAALADPDAQPATDEQLARGRRRPNVEAIREKMGLSVEEFGVRFGLSALLIRDWESGARWPDRPAQMLLRVIEREPEAVARAAAG